MGWKQGTQGWKTLKTIGSLKLASKSKKTKKSESMAPQVIDIMKPGSDGTKTQLGHKENQQLQSSIPSNETSPVVELDKINSAGGVKDMPPADASESIILTYALDEETRAATKTLKALKVQQGTADLPEKSSLLKPPGKLTTLTVMD